MKRRELIQWLVATVGLRAMQTYAPTELLALGRDVHRRTRPAVPSTQTQRTIAIAAERILPGATEAKVGAFIDTMLADWHTPEEREGLLAGLRELDTRSQARARRDFADCPEAEQVAVLMTLDDEVAALRARSNEQANQHWFAMLKFVTVYGWATSEPGMRELQLYPLPWRYDGCAPV
jgi:glucoside 3-dehydrogenase (cytochrome c) hitch-hiker subunit